MGGIPSPPLYALCDFSLVLCFPETSNDPWPLMAEKVCEGPEPDSPFTVITQLSYSLVCARAASVLGCRPSQILLSCTDPETNKQVPITSSTVLQYYVLVKRNLRTSQSHWLWLDVRSSGPEAESDHGEQPEEPQDEQQRGAEPQDGEQHDDLSTLSPPKRAAAAGMTMIRPSTINKNDFWHVSAAIFDGAKKDFQRRYHYAGQIMETDKGMIVKPPCSECKAKGIECTTFKPEHQPVGHDGKPSATCAWCRVKNGGCDLRKRNIITGGQAGEQGQEGAQGEQIQQGEFVSHEEHNELKDKVDSMQEQLTAVGRLLSSFSSSRAIE